ncbi:uncharacterized protein LOC124441691 [Xenia sp. Carnegie-2017]|uniref:uncharacterized protein LOC124441691 n=1 Tax=Xenia sp. Carnegie-2017 TaxID=2897299 RepID=UPI001F0360C8|nr:uncharacterized protein LOC124441691 [Xenia sp. Carnegie-2017]
MISSNIDETDVPPLDDFSDVLKKVQSLQLTERSRVDKTVSTKEIEKGLKGLWWLSKGFLVTKKCSEKKQTKSRKDDQIPVILHKPEKTSSLSLPEVQKAMETTSFLQNRDWVTDELLKKLEERPDMLKKLADPRYSQALNMFRNNPEEGMKLLQDKEELQNFIKEFCGILGEHFTSMADQKDICEKESIAKTSSATKQDQEQMNKILSDPTTLEVLKDPWVSKLIMNLKENPVEARRMLATSKPEVLSKIKILIDAGILGYE